MIRLVKGDITELKVDAIVNAANSRLIMGGGVAGAILKKAGNFVQKECDELGGTYVGGAVITSAGNLKAGYIIHAVGPRVSDSDADAKLKSATLSSLNIANDKKFKTIAFPAVSTGVFRYPKDKCASIMIPAAMDFIETHDFPKDVIFCLYDDLTYNIFSSELKKHI